MHLLHGLTIRQGLSSFSRPFSQLIKIEKAEKIATISMNSPPVNTLNFELTKELKEALVHVHKDSDVRALILTSSIKNVFSSGISVPVFLSSRDEFQAFWKEFLDIFKILFNSRMISVAAINGHAPAGGCILTLPCHYRIMLRSQDPKKPFTIGLNEVAVGLPVPAWLCYRFRELTSRKAAERFLPVGALLPTDEAANIGLVDVVVNTPEELQAASMKYAQTMIQGVLERPQVTTLRYLREESSKTIEALMKNDAALLSDFLDSEDFKKNARAFLANLQAKKK